MSGLPYLMGYLKNGYRHGRGQEYDLNGKMTFDGYNNQGKRMKIHQVPEMKRYWKELDENDIVTCISKRDDHRNKYGICYLHNRNEMSCICEWKKERKCTLSNSLMVK